MGLTSFLARARRQVARLAFALAAAAVACSAPDADPDSAVADATLGDAAAPSDAPVPDGAAADASLMPASLEDTGLYADFAAGTLAPGIVEFVPAHHLWSDGAAKRRFFYLPPGTQIDTSDMDFWRFPVGTKVWKEFTAAGVRVETRLLYKTGPQSYDWFMMAYAWNVEQTATTAATIDVEDALGTTHDIPAPHQCLKCHDRTPDIVLGVSALQLAHDQGDLTLASLVADGRLTAAPAGPLVIPGDAIAVAALGYLHANCGNCHNPHSDVAGSVGLRTWLTVDALGAVGATATYQTAVGQVQQKPVTGATAIIEPGNPEQSAVHVRMASREAIAMPPVASERVDDVGLAAVDAWIDALPAAGP
jgi:hypothetical protein